MDCCSVYTEQFDRDAALSQAQRYRTKGLDRMARAMRDTLVRCGLKGARVLEFGGGVGGLSLDLLKAGAASATNVELSTAYREAASTLALEAGLEDRFRLLAGDALDVADTVDDAEIVVMNKVVCCYPEGDELMDVAIGKATRYLGVSFPTVHFASRAVIGVENWLRARRGSDFRAYVHPKETFERPATAGFEEIFRRTGPVWDTRVWERSQSPESRI